MPEPPVGALTGTAAPVASGAVQSVARDDVALGREQAADANDAGQFQPESVGVGVRDEPRRVGPDEASRDDAIGEDDLHARRGPAVDDEALQHEREAALDDEDARDGSRIRPVDLDEVDRVVRQARAVRVGARSRLRIAVDRDGVRDRRQGGGRRERVHAASRNVEGDRIGAGIAVGVEDRLAQRPHAGVVRVRHGEGHRGCRRRDERERGEDREPEARTDAHGTSLRIEGNCGEPPLRGA